MSADPLVPLLRLAGRRADVPPERAERVRAAVHAAWLQSRRARFRRRLGVSAMATLAAGLVVAVSWPLRHAAPPAEVPARFAHVERAAPGAGWSAGAAVPVGVAIDAASGLALRTAEGVSLRLAAGARLVPVAARRVRLEAGAVYVDSASVSGLVIEAPGATVTEIGTQFEVRIAAAGLRVRVREGRVLVQGDAPDHRWSVHAGEQVRLVDDRAERSSVAPAGPEWAWAQALARPPRIEGQPLRPFLEWAARERGLRLEFSDPDAARLSEDLRLHGDVSDLGLDQALEVVLATTGFEAEPRQDRLRVAAH